MSTSRRDMHLEHKTMDARHCNFFHTQQMVILHSAGKVNSEPVGLTSKDCIHHAFPFFWVLNGTAAMLEGLTVNRDHFD